MSIDIRFQTGGPDAINAHESKALGAFLAALHGISLDMPVSVTSGLGQVIPGGAVLKPAAPPAPPSPPAPAAPAPSDAGAAQSSTAPVDQPASSTAAAPAPSTPPAPPAPASVAPSAPATSALPAGVVVDSAGLPWDARIHSSTKVLNADKTWRQKRNLEKSTPGLLAQVTAELQAWVNGTGPAPVAAAAEPETAATPPAGVAPPPPPAGAADPVADAFAAAAAAAPPPPASAGAPTPPPPPASAAAPTPPPPPAAASEAPPFVRLIQEITGMKNQGMLSDEELNQAFATAGVLNGLAGIPGQQVQDPGVVGRLKAEIDKLLAD